jgi:hypothetical protein
MTKTFKTISLAAPILLLAALPLSAAEGIGGKNEKPLEVEGTVVDLLCEVAKRCAPNCGEGKRQLGIKLSDGKLLVAAKNTDLFAGAVVDLAPLCGKVIKADGILFENPKMPIYMVQGIKTDLKAAEYTPVDGFGKAWTAKNGGAASDEWFRTDPAVKAQIAKTGPLGRPELKPKAQ